MHFFAGSEEREHLLPHRNGHASSGIATRPSFSDFYRKDSETAQFNTVPAGHRVGDLIQNGTNNLIHVALVKMSVRRCNALN
jgi:hypothetical protein